MVMVLLATALILITELVSAAHFYIFSTFYYSLEINEIIFFFSRLAMFVLQNRKFICVLSVFGESFYINHY
jgi:hypothetical protein